MEQKKYGFFTSVAMIIGIVIGSGIFFKSDNILIATNGSIPLGIFFFCIAALSIIFGSLTIAELASQDDKAGGLITYSEVSLGESAACAIGWFQTFLYYPTLIAVVSWVVGIYSCILFGITNTLETQIIIGTCVIIFLFIMNILSAKLGGYFQNAATVIKLIPLIIIGILGFVFGKPSSFASSSNVIIAPTSWLAALSPILFAFDGWVIATSLAHEIKNAKRNLPLALIISPLAILLMYLLYFVGISIFIGPENVMQRGDAHVDYAANMLFGSWGAKAMLVFIIISVAGTSNGVIMGMMRLPYSLALRGMFPQSKHISKLSPKYGISISSALVSLVISLFWMLVHYITQKYNLLPNSDISEISITILYGFYIILYIQVFRSSFKNVAKGSIKNKINPLLATLGSTIILIGGMQSPLFWNYALISFVIIAVAIVFWKYRNRSNTF